jgi:hypothetical protein
VFGAGPSGSLAQLGRACGIGDGVETWVGAGGCRRLRQLRRLRGLVHVHCAAGVSFSLWVFCLYISVRNGGDDTKRRVRLVLYWVDLMPHRISTVCHS